MYKIKQQNDSYTCDIVTFHAKTRNIVLNIVDWQQNVSKIERWICFYGYIQEVK